MNDIECQYAAKLINRAIVMDLWSLTEHTKVTRQEFLDALARIQQQAQEREGEIARLRGLVTDTIAWFKSCGFHVPAENLHTRLTAEAKPEAPAMGTVGRTPEWRENMGYFPQDAPRIVSGSVVTVDAGCVDPFAPSVSCIVCQKPVRTCERKSADALQDYRCPAHPDGVQLNGGKWVCSEACWDEATKDKPESPAPVTECACRKALELALSMIDQNYPVAAAVDDCRATLATPCSCTELREEAESDKWKQLDIAVSDNGRLRAELAAANERAERTEERAEKQHAVLTRAVDKHCAMRLHAERELAVARKDLREAVEALRKLTAESSGFLAQAEDDAREVFGNTNIAVLHHWIDNAAAIVARFDAQGESRSVAKT